MARYRVIAKTFINNTLIDPETMPPEKCIVEWNGRPGTSLELITNGQAEPAAEPAAEKPARKWTPKAARASDEAA